MVDIMGRWPLSVRFQDGLGILLGIVSTWLSNAARENVKTQR